MSLMTSGVELMWRHLRTSPRRLSTMYQLQHGSVRLVNLTAVTQNRFIKQSFPSAPVIPLPRYLSTSSKPVFVVEHPYELDGYKPDDGESSPAEDVADLHDRLFAVVELSGTQYKVTEDDVIIADRMEDIDIGQTISLDKVLLVGSKVATVIGQPYVGGAQVDAVVEERARDKKVITFKMRRRKSSRSKEGFRRQVTVLRIADILVDGKTRKELLPKH